MPCSVEGFGERLMDHGPCERQSAEAPSSGETEHYAMTRGAASGIHTTSRLKALDTNCCKS